MSRRRPRDGKRHDGDGLTSTVSVCRGCCCGSPRKHPTTDHEQQLARLTTGLAGAGRLRVTDCLDACEHSNVMVISPSRAGRSAGARPTWLGGVLDQETVGEVIAWVRAGGPGVVDPPPALDELRVRPPARRARLAGTD